MISNGISLISRSIYRTCAVPKTLCLKNQTNSLRYFASGSHIVQMRGLDPETREEDIIGFFRPLGITPKKIHLRWDGSGRTASVSEVEFNTHAEAVVAMRKRNAFLGNKFIRLTLKSSENDAASKKDKIPDPHSSVAASLNVETKSDMPVLSGAVLHMKNVPWRITDQDIYDFFWPVGALSISVKPFYNESGFRTGEFDVQFLTEEDAVRAMVKNNAYLGNKFVQLSFKNS